MAISQRAFFFTAIQYNVLAVVGQVDTVDENENEMAGRGMMSNREIKEGDELFSMPIDLLLTKEAAKKVG